MTSYDFTVTHTSKIVESHTDISMSEAVQELESVAGKYAAEAIRQDAQGARGIAITNYQRVIRSFDKTDSPVSRKYFERGIPTTL